MFLNSKIPKSQIRNFLGTMLLLGLLFQGCKQKEILPEDAFDTKKALAIAQAKKWFQQYQLKLRSQKNGSDSIVREPDWQKVVYQVTADSTAAVFLETSLTFNTKYKAFRKTDANGNKYKGYSKVLLQQISATEFRPIEVHLYADSAYLKQSNTTLAQHTFTDFENSFTGEAFFYDWETGVCLGANKFEQGNLIATLKTAQNREKLNCITFPVTVITTAIDESGGYIPGDNPTFTTTVTTIYQTTCWQDGTGTSTGGGSGGYGGGGYVAPPPVVTPPDYKYSEAFKKIADTTRTDRNDPDVQAMDKEIQRLYNESCLFRCMINQLSAAKDPDDNTKPFRIRFKTQDGLISSAGTAGKYDPYTKTITIDYDMAGDPRMGVVLHEEVIHTYQDIFDMGYNRNISPPNFKGAPNIEVDAKMLIDIQNYRYKMLNGKYLHNKVFHVLNKYKHSEDYQKYLEAITNNGVKNPSSFSELSPANMTTYHGWVAYFRGLYASNNPNHPYAGQVDNDKQPKAIMRLIQTCTECN
jgi:hypothetical protein